MTDLMTNLKLKIKETFLNIISDEELDNLIKNEIDSFFELREQSYGALSSMTMSLKEAREAGYDYTSISGWNTSDNAAVSVKKVNFITPMSPFRHLVWNELGVVLNNKIKNLINDDKSDFNIKLSKWFTDEAATNLSTINTINFNNLSMLMAKQNQYEIMTRAMESSAFLMSLVSGNGGPSASHLETAKDHIKHMFQSSLKLSRD